MNPPSITQEIARSNKRYSFLNVLDHVATSSVGLTFAPASATAYSTPHQKREDACRRLSQTLQTLTTREYGHKHLPELPVPSYDNGTIDISPTSCSKFCCSDIVSTQTGLKAPRSTPQEPRYRQHLPLASLGRTFNAYAFGEMTQSPEHISNNHRNSPRPERNIAQNSNSDVPVQKPRPDSCTDASTTRRVAIHKRPGSTDSAARAGRARKKSVTYDDQRACRPKIRHSLKHTHSPCLQTARRGYQLVASLKDWRTKGDKKHRPEERTPIDQEEEPQIMPMLSLKEALRGVAPLPPLHDPKHDQHFAQECSKLLSLRRDPSKCSFIDSPPTKQLPEPPREVPPISSEVVSRPSMHTHTASEAMSVSTSILDLDWPQPGGYKTLRSDETADIQPTRPESPPIPLYATDDEDPETFGPLISLATSPHLDSFPRLWTAPIVEKRTARSPPPSAPPERPLPRLPMTKIKANTKQRLNSAQTRHRPTAEDSTQLWGKPSSTTCRPVLAQSRLSILATSKGLKVDSSIASRADTLSQSGKEQSAAAPPSPLNLWLTKSNRNSRVNELKRRHVSMLIKDGVNFVAFEQSGVDTVDFARRGSAADAMQTSSAYSSHSMRPSTNRRRVSIDKQKPLPLTPVVRAHSAKISVSCNSAHPQTSTCGRNSRANSRSKRDTRLSLGPASSHAKPMQMLSQSDVMTLVDTDPRASHGFRAGAVSPFPGSKCKRTTRQGSRPTPLSHTRSTSIDGSRPSSCQSPTHCWSPSSESSDYTATTVTTVPSSPNFASLMAEIPLVASFDSGYASGHDTRPNGADGSRRNATGIEILATRSRQLDNQEQLASSRSNAVVSDNSSEQKVEELKDEVDRMKRVYNAMLRARQGLAQEDMGNKRYAELLEDDERRRAASFRNQTSNVLAKIEADLASSPPSADSDSEETITPSSLPKPVIAISSAPNRKGDIKEDVACSVSASGSDIPAPLRIPSSSYPAPLGSSATVDTSIESPAQLPFKAGSTLLSATRRPPQPAVRHPQTFAPTPQSKRYSVLSQYNPYPKTQRSPSTVAADSPPRAVPGRLPPKQVAICPRTPAQDIDQEIDFNNAVPPFLTNTRQMDRAIDEFKASTDPDQDGDRHGGRGRTFEGQHGDTGIIRLRITDGQFRVM
ncbi:hypothetical protein LTR24_005041 [Lithohypha guttulata]|uniref:Uncharacterized protein n=1 Tax=Lithohypha guttulata TaxID=1690604 RepID=A0ABR0KA11_9EURO|nr:hypothetical protein LTR24_005041 [Lithohypha guttulata]